MLPGGYALIHYANCEFDKDLHDPVWELTSLRIKKYIPFLNIDIFKYKKILKELVL